MQPVYSQQYFQSPLNSTNFGQGIYYANPQVSDYTGTSDPRLYGYSGENPYYRNYYPNSFNYPQPSLPSDYWQPQNVDFPQVREPVSIPVLNPSTYPALNNLSKENLPNELSLDNKRIYRQENSMTPESLEKGKLHRASYSDVLDMLKEGRLKKVRIESRPDRLGDLPQAKLTTQDNQQFIATLPNQNQSLLEQLSNKGVQYEFDEQRQSVGHRAKNFLEQVMKDSIAPTVILGVGGLVGLGVWQYIIKPLQAKAPVENALRNALKTFNDVQHNVDEQLQYYDPQVKDAVNKFRTHQKDFLLFLGPPGTGKSHLMEALGKEVVKRPGTVALFANVEAGDTAQDSSSVRDLLLQIFSGNKETTQKALNILNKIAGTKVKELVVMANELEQFSDVMNKVIVNGMGNPTSPIKLRILATGNELPGLDAAANNRIQGGITYVDYTQPEKMSGLIQSVLSKSYPTASTAKAKSQLTQILKNYPGYSTRTIVEDILKPMKEEAQTAPVSNPVEAFEKRLANQKLNDSEIAGLLRQLIHERLSDEVSQTSGKGGFTKDGVMLLNRKMMREAQKATQNLGVELLMNGKQLKALMGQIIDQLPHQEGITKIHVPPKTTSEYIQVLEAVKNDLNQCKIVGPKPQQQPLAKANILNS